MKACLKSKEGDTMDDSDKLFMTRDHSGRETHALVGSEFYMRVCYLIVITTEILRNPNPVVKSMLPNFISPTLDSKVNVELDSEHR